MACEPVGDLCPRPGDGDNILLRKILLALTSGSGVAGGQGIVETEGGTVNFAQSGPYTPGAIPFATGPTTMGFDPANLFWDDINNRLGLNTNIPASPLHLISPQIVAGTFDTSLAASRLDFYALGLKQGQISWGSSTTSLFSVMDVLIGTFAGLGEVYFNTNNINRWKIDTTGALEVLADNIYDIGFPSIRVRTLYTGTSVFTPQVQFPAVQVPSADPNNLDDYEEGGWTPSDGSGAGLALTVVAADCAYTKIGRYVTAIFRIVYPATANGLAAAIVGLPFVYGASGTGAGGHITFTDVGVSFMILGSGVGNAGFFFPKYAGGAFVINSELSGATISGVVTYFT